MQYLLIAPSRFEKLIDLHLTESGGALYYPDSFDASSYRSTFMSSSASAFLSQVNTDRVVGLIVPDIAYSFSNYLVSYVASRNKSVSVVFYMDGSGSMMSCPLSATVRIRDILKYLFSVVARGERYITRLREQSGADMELCKKQLSIIANERLSYKHKVHVVPELFEFPRGILANKNIVLFVLQDAKVVMPKYTSLYLKTIQYIQKSYPGFETMVLLRNRDHYLHFCGNTIVERKFVGESAESIVSRISPKVVISHYSSVLLNLAMTGYSGEIVSFGMRDFIKMAGASMDLVNEVQIIHFKLGIDTIECKEQG